MRVVPNKLIFCFVVVILPFVRVFAAPNPPAPGLPPPPPGTPINDSIWILIILSIVLGFYNIRKFKLINKVSK